MRTFRYDKLVRDGITPAMLAEGCVVEQCNVVGTEAVQLLRQKLLEETNELDGQQLLAGGSAAVAELADVYEVLEALRALAGISSETLQAARDAKNAKAGAYESHTYIDTVQVPDGSPWIAYYQRNADRYPEIT